MKELAVFAALLILAIVPSDVPRSYADPPAGLDDLYAVEVAGKHYWLRYSITGGSLESIIAGEETATVAVMIQALQDGALEIYMPGSFLSSFQNPPLSFSELDAIIFIDELEATGEILQRGCDFAIRIPFEAGSKQIDIVGTFLIGSEPAGSEPAPKGQHINVRFPVNKEIQLGAITNADTCDFSFDQNEKRFHAELTGPVREEGHFQVTLPHEFLGGPYMVLINEQPVEFESTFSNATIRHTTTISFQYEGGDPASIDIIGTTAIPEFAAGFWIVTASIGAVVLLVRFTKFQKVL